VFVDRQLSAEHEECPDPVRSQCPEFMVLVDLVNFGTDPNNPNFADVATALGIHDHGVERPDEPAEALGAASTTPARPLVEAMTTQSNGPTVHDTPQRARVPVMPGAVVTVRSQEGTTHNRGSFPRRRPVHHGGRRLRRRPDRGEGRSHAGP
jgi:hypothetical protein